MRTHEEVAGSGRTGGMAERARCPPYALWRAALAALAILSIAATAQETAGAQPRGDPGEIHGLKLGLKADDMSTDTFGDLACGSNGGPPRQAIDDWSGFRNRRPEPS